MKPLNNHILTAALAALVLCSFALTASAETEDVIVNNKVMWSTAWSPDGKYIAYGSEGINVINLESGEIKNITEHIPTIITDVMQKHFDDITSGGHTFSLDDFSQFHRRPSFSADCKYVYYTHDNAYMMFDDPEWHFSYIRKVNIETGENETIREDGRGAVVSNDGTLIHYSKDEDYSAIYNLETGELKVYDFSVSGPAPNNLHIGGGHGDISDDNSHFLVALNALGREAQYDELNDRFRIYKVDMETGVPEKMPLPEGLNYTNPRYSPDETNILVETSDFYPEPSETRDPVSDALYEHVYDTLDLYILSEELLFHSDSTPYQWVPIDSYEEYLKLRLEMTIWQLPESQTDYMFLETPNNGRLEEPRWKTGVAIYDLITGEYTQLETADHYGANSPSWSPDGKQVCYVLENENDYFTALYVYNLETGVYKAVVPAYTITDPTAVEAPEEPAAFAITGNYPNPFNPATTIEFSLEKSGDVSLDIFNVMGQKVRSLESAYLVPGSHSIVWNGRDNSGNSVSSGVYISRLKMGEAVESKAMLLAK